MHATGSSSAERRRRSRGLPRRALALALSWTFAATSVWGPAPLTAAPLPLAERATDAALTSSAAAESSAEADASLAETEATPEPETPAAAAATGTTAATACDVTLWGPRRFTRTTGAPNVYTEAVGVPAWVRSPFALSVVNGEADGRRRVSSAWITVDGTQVAGPSDFSPQVATLDRGVTLRATSTLEVKLASAPNSFLQVGFCGHNADRTPPVVTWTAPTDGSSSSDTTPALAVSYRDSTGSGEPAASGVDPETLSVTLDGADRTALFVKRSGDASAALPAELALAQGLHRLVARVRDRAGNAAEATASFRVDSNPPRVVFAEPAGGSYVRPPVRLRLTTQDDRALDGLTLQVLVNGSDRTSLFARGATEAVATLDLASGLVEGANQAEARVRDAAGNESSAAVPFNVDGIGPELVIVSPGGGSHQGSANVEVVLQYRDSQALDIASLEATIDGTPAALAIGPDGASGWVGPLSDGAHRLAARVRDRAGNGGSAESAFRVDTRAPALQIAQPAAGALLNTRTPDLLVAYGDADGIDTASLRVSLNGVDRTSLFTIGPDAAWATLPAGLALGDGVNRVAATVKDLTGNETSAASEFLVDTEGPTVTFGAPPQTTGEANPAVKLEWTDAVSGVDTASARIVVDGVDRTALFALDTAGASGVLALDQRLPDGPHVLAVSVADRAGNLAPSTTRTFLLDTAPPAVAFASPEANAFISERTPQLRVSWSDAQGAGVDPATAHVFLRAGDEAEVEITGALQVGADGAEGRVAETAALADGTYTLRVALADRAGNVRSAETRFEVDTVAPVCAVESPVNTAVLGTRTPSFDVRCSDERSGIDPSRIVLRVDGVDRSARLSWAAGRATGTLAGDEALGQGGHTLELQVLDRAGNAAAIPAIGFQVDTVAPAVGIDQPANASFVATPSPQLRATLADAGDAPSGLDPTSVRVELDGVDRSAAFPFADGVVAGTLGPLADGPHVVVVRGADLAGNPATATAGFVVDTQPPAVREFSLPDNAWIAQLDADGRLAVSGQLEDLDPRLSVKCSVDGASVAASVVGGGFSCSLPLGEGSHSVEVDVSDGGGHTTQLKRTVNVDVTPPSVHIVDPSDDSYTNATGLTVTGTVVDRSTVQVSVSGVAAVVTGQTFVATGVPVGDGPTVTVTATAVDEARNKAEHAIVLHVDRTAPVVHITRPRPGDASRTTAVPVEGTYQDDSPVSIVYVNGQLAALQPTSTNGRQFRRHGHGGRRSARGRGERARRRGQRRQRQRVGARRFDRRRPCRSTSRCRGRSRTRRRSSWGPRLRSVGRHGSGRRPDRDRGRRRLVCGERFPSRPRTARRRSRPPPSTPRATQPRRASR